jgi:CheY-like chemotaxis protein
VLGGVMSNRPKVVVVDSDEKSIMYLSTLLDRMNFVVFPVRNAQEAFELARIVNPNLFFLESSVDENSSLEMLEQIRKDNLLTKVPVVMVGNSESNIEKCFAAGCSDFLMKPFGLTFLNLSVQKCFPNREGMRKHLRAPYNKNISLEHDGLETNCFGITLSEGGVYLRANKPLPVNSKVKMKFQLITSDEVVLKGTVIYNMGLSRGSFLIPPGMAIQFDDCESEEMKAISKDVAQLLIGDLVGEQEVPVFQSDKGSN